jgi:CxxC-x17-CxxC domain-containing protein
MKRDSKDSNGSGFSAIESLNKYSDFNSRDVSTPREMHTTKCADCGNTCEVPFKPKEGRPVYCRDCFHKHKPKRF